jgi:hypothetical protein
MASWNRAIADYEQALDLLSDGEVPSEWADVQTGLGNLYLALFMGDEADNARRAIEHYQAALTKCPKSEFP